MAGVESRFVDEPLAPPLPGSEDLSQAMRLTFRGPPSRPAGSGIALGLAHSPEGGLIKHRLAPLTIFLPCGKRQHT